MGMDPRHSQMPLMAALLAPALLLACSSGPAAACLKARDAAPRQRPSGASSSPSANAPAAAPATPAPLVPARVAYTTIAAVQSPFWIAFEAGDFLASRASTSPT